jgi:hypothetical protein
MAYGSNMANTLNCGPNSPKKLDLAFVGVECFLWVYELNTVAAIHLNCTHYVYPCQRYSTGHTLEDYNP